MSGRVVVVGASAAGVAACAGLRAAGFEGEVVLVGEESHAPYERPPLSKQVLCGADHVGLPAARRLTDAAVVQRLGARATRLDVGRGVVELDHREELAFDGLVVATGSTPRRLPGQPQARGLHVLRTLDHALALRDDLAGARRVAVIGGGFVGLEVAASARSLGVAVTVLESAPAPLARVLGPDVGARFVALHEAHGVEVRCGVTVAGLQVTDGRVAGVDLGADGSIEADVVLVGIGAVAATDWLTGSGLAVGDGLVCDQTLRAAPGIYGAGDVARWQHPLFGSIRVEHRMTAAEHGRTAGENLAAELAGRDEDAKPADQVPSFWSDQYDVKVMTVGWLAGYDETHELPAGENGHGILFGRDGRLVAAMGWNAPAFVARRRTAIAAGMPLAEAAETAAAPAA